MAMSDYSPSFYDTGASRRDQERRGSYGGLGEYRAAGAYINPSAFDYGSYRSNSGMVGTLPGPNRTNFRKPHANMTSTDREEMMRMQAQQVQVERQRQVEEKRMREAERKERERLEDQQLEENIRKQQEKMRQEYEEENNRKKKKEAEQIRRREAQLAHLEAARLRAEEEKKKHLAGSHRSDASHGRDLYSRGKSTTEPESSSYRNRFTNAQDEERFGSHQGSSVSGRTRRGRDWPDDQRPARPDADFGLNLGQAAYHTHLSTAFPNRFFDRKRTEKVATRSRPPSPQFDWKIKVDNLSEEEKNKLNQSSEEEIRNFRDKNTDVMSQLSAMKRDLRTGAGRDGNNRPPSSEPKKDENSGFADTIPAGPGDSDVDYYKVPTAPPSPDNTRKTDRANNRRRAQASSIDLDGTSGTVLRKYLEHTKATLQS
ncbi:uncharacterized protein LOC143038133 isoform X2 [Oratosquilla oratoria]|uniref:uncharacterized protein LOC143038133 isoform X2 n=1 Tax=Oratosquilla oratoria TaxID=337810 RepID=UPI003F76C6CA